jgi:hypothetical protein
MFHWQGAGMILPSHRTVSCLERVLRDCKPWKALAHVLMMIVGRRSDELCVREMLE